MSTQWLQGVLFCEFDNHRGQKISHQSPPNCFTDSAFDDIANFIIPKTELNGRISHLKASTGTNILYVCRQINADHYPRHKFIISLAFVFHPSTPAEVVRPFREPLRKVVAELVALEQNGCVLFRQSTQANDITPEQMAKLPSMDSRHYGELFQISDVVKGLYASLSVAPYECALALHPSRVVIVNALCKAPLLDTSGVHPWTVPIRLRPMSSRDGADIFLVDLMKIIDGKTHCLALARRMQAETRWLLRALQHLVGSGYVETVDIFQFSNLYAVTEKFALYPTSATREVINAFVASVVDLQPTIVSRRGQRGPETCSMPWGATPENFSLPGFPTLGGWDLPTAQLPAPSTEDSFSCCMWLLSKFSQTAPCESVWDVMGRAQHTAGASCWKGVTPFITATKLVRAGLLAGIVRRVHEYPERKSRDHQWGPSVRDHVEEKDVNVSSLLDGLHSMDELCVRLMTPRVYLQQEWKEHVMFVRR